MNGTKLVAIISDAASTGRFPLHLDSFNVNWIKPCTFKILLIPEIWGQPSVIFTQRIAGSMPVSVQLSCHCILGIWCRDSNF